MGAGTPPPKSKLNPKTVRKAVKALLKRRNSDSDEFTYLVLTLHKIPPKDGLHAFKIPLPNPLLPSSTQFCLIYDDRRNSNLTMDHIQKRINSQNIPITKTLKLSKLCSDYKSFQDKRNLMESYDCFLADKRIVELLPRCLGKAFYKKKRTVPVPVDLQRRNWKEQVERVMESATVFLSSGTCSAVRVGRTSMSVEEIVENVVAAVEGIVEIVPRKWKGVRSFHLKLLESLALPVYQAVPDETLLRMEGGKDENKDMKEKRKGEEAELKKAKWSKDAAE